MINDLVYSCTSSSIWVCMIEGRFLVANGHTAWKRKSDAVKAFKNSDYWAQLVDDLKQKNPNLIEEGYRHSIWWKDSKVGKELENNIYVELLKTQRVKYIEITPVPDWI